MRIFNPTRAPTWWCTGAPLIQYSTCGRKHTNPLSSHTYILINPPNERPHTTPQDWSRAIGVAIPSLLRFPGRTETNRPTQVRRPFRILRLPLRQRKIKQRQTRLFSYLNSLVPDTLAASPLHFPPVRRAICVVTLSGLVNPKGYNTSRSLHTRN